MFFIKSLAKSLLKSMDFSSWHQQTHDSGHLYFLNYNLLLDTFLFRFTAPNFLKAFPGTFERRFCNYETYHWLKTYHELWYQTFYQNLSLQDYFYYFFLFTMNPLKVD